PGPARCDGPGRRGKRRRGHVVAARRRARGPLRTPARHRDGAGEGGMGASLVVSIHDVAPSPAFAARAWVGELDRRHVPATLLVVPGPWEGPPLRLDRNPASWLHERGGRGEEVAPNGWPHPAGPGAPPCRPG